jgi:hypothetical protein
MEKKDDNIKDFLVKMMKDGSTKDFLAKMTKDLHKFDFDSLLDGGLFDGGSFNNDDITNTLMKSTTLIMKMEGKLKYLESLLGPVTMIARNCVELNIDNYDENQVEEVNNAMIKINNILKNLEVQEIECNGDCNNCDREH